MFKKFCIYFLLAIMVFPLSGFKRLPELQGEIHVIDDAIFNNVNAGIELGGPWEAIDVMQASLEENNSAWAQYTWEDSKGEEHTLVEYVWDISHAQLIGVNPRVLLVTAGVSLEWLIPPQTDFRDTIGDMGVTLMENYWKYEYDGDVKTRYPEVSNASSYALYAIFDFNLEKLNTWQQTYQKMFGKETTILTLRATESSFPQPFMAKPFTQPAAPTPFYTIHSFLDHNAPYDYEEGTLSRFDGLDLMGILDDCDEGKSCYSGHEGYDFDTGRDHPTTKPEINPVASGVVSAVVDLCGQVEIEHENENIFTVYLHMEDIRVSKGDTVSKETILGLTGNVADPKGKKCKSTGAHLHFHAYAEGSRRNLIDPFGWWDANGDSDPLEDFSPNGNSGSKWLWRGDETGDGFLTVDNRESQAQLFHIPNDYESGQTWWHNPNGYQNESWWTYSVIDENNSTNWAIWGSEIEQSGNYCISAHWPQQNDNTTSARYRIFSENQGLLDTVVKNQRTDGDSWIPLGEYNLETGPSVVILTDFVGSSGNTGEKVYFDAVRWKQGPCTPPTPPPTPTETPTPPPVSSTITVQITDGSEDAGIEPGGCAFTATNNEIYIGECNNGNLITSGFRFGGVPIPKGAQIQEAYLEFTVDGDYFIPVLVLISGEDSGDAQPFSNEDQPSERTVTAASTAWDIPASEVWNLGNIHRTPEMKAVVQEIVDRPDWGAYQGMAFILDTLSSAAGQHRRVIGYERPEWYPGSEHAARLIVTYLGTTPPTPTPPTPTPPTPTPPTPSPPPFPDCIFEWIRDIFNKNSSVSMMNGEVPQSTGTPTLNSFAVSERLEQAVDLVKFAPLLNDLRDDFLSQSQQGLYYTALYQEYSAEIAVILIQNEELYNQGYEILASLEPNLQALLDGTGDTVTITNDQVIEIQAFLYALAVEASQPLKKAIQTEREHRPLEALIGLSMDEAWNHINGYKLAWLPPISKTAPYQARVGSTIPIQFRLETLEGEFVEDETVLLQVINEAGEVVLGPFSQGKYPPEGITVQGKKYHLNLETQGLEPGLYTVEVYYNAVEPGEPATWNLSLWEK